MSNLTAKQKTALENASETQWKLDYELVPNTRSSARQMVIKSLLDRGLIERAYKPHAIDYVYRLTPEGAKARNGEKVTPVKQHDFTVGQTVEYRDWGWVQTEDGKRQWGMIWTEVEIIKITTVRVQIKFPNGITQYCDPKNLRAIVKPVEYIYLCLSRPPMYGTVPQGFEARKHTDSVYGTVVYKHPLTLMERYKYQLRLVSPMFIPVKGMKVCWIDGGKVHEDVLDQPHEDLPLVWYTENEGHIRLADCEVIE